MNGSDDHAPGRPPSKYFSYGPWLASNTNWVRYGPNTMRPDGPEHLTVPAAFSRYLPLDAGQPSKVGLSMYIKGLHPSTR